MVLSPVMKSLMQVPIFRGLTEAEAAEIFEISEETSAKKGDTLFREGDPGDALFVVLEGTVEVTKKDRSDGQRSLATLGEGSALGEMSIIAGDAARSASVRATADVKLLKTHRAAFSKLLAQDRVAALKVVHNLAHVLARRLLLMDEKLVDTLTKTERKDELTDFQRILANWSF